MPGQLEIGVSIICVLILLPLALRGLIYGIHLPAGGILTKYFEAEKHLSTVGNVFLLVVSAAGLVKIANYFGLVDAASAEQLSTLVGIATTVMLAIYIAVWVMAIRKVGRSEA